MSPNRRIFLNIIATYGRSLYALVIGLFCGRWALMALGQVDYGLMGVVGGLMAFVTFVNDVMASSVSRFYAFAVGQSSSCADKNIGVEECRRWFSIAFLLHAVVSVALVLVGYPIGVVIIRQFLVVPVDRIDACIWVWRFVCVGGFMSMISVPFSAMYNAKQEIAELTVYSFASATCNLLVLWYMVNHPGVWLEEYSFYGCAISVVTMAIICWRAVAKYEECRFRLRYVKDISRARSLFAFAGSRFLASLSMLMSTQGLTLVVNKYLGPIKNAAMGIGNSIVSHSGSLSSSIRGAMSPAVTNFAGAGDMNAMRRLAMRSSRFSAISVMVFAIPLLLEVKEVVHLWLKTPPEGTVAIVPFLLLNLILSGVSEGHYMSIFAAGRIARFQAWESIWFFGRFGLGWCLVVLGFDLMSIGIAYVVTGVGSVMVKLWFGRKLCGISVRDWLREIAIPIGGLFAVSIIVGAVPVFVMKESFVRVLVTTAVVEVVFVPFVWFFVLSTGEREFLAAKIKGLAR